MQSVLLTLSTTLALIAPATYVISIVRGRSRPHRITRLALLVVLTLNFASIVAADGNTGLKLLSFIYVLHALIIFIMSLWRGMGGSNSFDWACLTIALVGIIGWQLTGDPLVGVWLAVLADVAAYTPAVIKTWKEPSTESPWLYSLSAISVFLGLIAYDLSAVSIFQIYLLISCFAMLLCIYRVRIFGLLPVER